ncbi:MAG: discoidin domain-containing protein, partial [Coriobacteriia bacterium]
TLPGQTATATPPAVVPAAATAPAAAPAAPAPAAAPAAPAPAAHDLDLVGVRASSENSDGKDYYPAEYATDGNPNTCWEEAQRGTEDDGLGEWLEASFGEQATVTEIRAIPGYRKNEEGWNRWWTNGRLGAVRFTYDDGSSDAFTFRDQEGWQTFKLPAPKQTNTVRMTILSAYPPRAGTHHAHDTSVSEIVFGGWLTSAAGTP